MTYFENLEQLEGSHSAPEKKQNRDFKSECTQKLNALKQAVGDVEFATKTVQDWTDKIFISAGLDKWETSVFIRRINLKTGTSQSENWKHIEGQNPRYSMTQFKNGQWPDWWKQVYNDLEIKSDKGQSDFYKTLSELLNLPDFDENKK